MAKAKQDLSEARSCYDRDFFAWTREQAALLRREAARGLASDLQSPLPGSVGFHGVPSWPAPGSHGPGRFLAKVTIDG
jgi:hypothetical protein